MIVPRPEPEDDERPLEALGVGRDEEAVYRLLLAQPGLPVSRVARALSVTPGKVQRLVDRLEAMGLATHTPERPRRYMPVSPDIAVEALLLRRQEKLQRARGAIKELQNYAASKRPVGEEQMVEMITSREAEQQIFEQLHRTAQNEVVTLTRPPLRISRLDVDTEVDHWMQREARARGVRYRSIVDSSFLSMDGAIERVQADINAGEEIRIFPFLPLKMVLTDQRIAFVPLNLQQAQRPSLLIRSSTLLNALYAMFNMLWERATPISFSSSGERIDTQPKARLSPDEEKLVSLMAAGLNDKLLAHELGISPRTLNRRISGVLRTMDARTRFQAGWQAALRLSSEGREQPAGSPGDTVED